MTFAQAADIDPQATLLRDQHFNQIVSRHDRMFAALLPIQWIAGIIAAVWISPRTWNGAASQVHPHVMTAFVLGGVICSLPVFLAITRPGHVLTRHAIAVGQMLFSALLIHLTGGRIETHFHVFGSLAFLAFYRDWRVLITATVVVAADHMLRGIFWPESVFGVATASQWRWVEHAGWVVFEDVFLIMSCVRGQSEMLQIAQKQASLEGINAKIEAQVENRTAELRSSEEALKIAKEAAENASRSKSAFLANMSHEIRTPMTAILGFADMLLDPSQDVSERLNHVQIIRRNGQHLLTVINDILDISRIEAGRMTVERIECRPPALLAEVISLMQVRAAEKGIKLRVDVDGPLPQQIQSDPTRLRQILLNLVGNAIKFSDVGEVCIKARLRNGDQPRIEFEVIDRGVGMTPQQVAKLFEPFVQADDSMTRRFGGTGLGLAISMRLAQLLGGTIAVRSSPGAGSTFTLSVPTGPLDGVAMTTHAAAGVTASPGEPRRAQPAVGAAKVLAGMRILLAEDGIDNQRLIGMILRLAGADVEIVGNGREACDAAQQQAAQGTPFDCILMDMQMPEMDGYAATSKLRTRGYRGTIIALTANAMDADRARCLSAGCDDYATKPIEKQKMLAMLEQVKLRRAA